jgi:hypothetical protein
VRERELHLRALERVRQLRAGPRRESRRTSPATPSPERACACSSDGGTLSSGSSAASSACKRRAASAMLSRASSGSAIAARAERRAAGCKALADEAKGVWWPSGTIPTFDT